MGNKNSKIKNKSQITFYKSPIFWLFIILIAGGIILYYLLNKKIYSVPCQNKKCKCYKKKRKKYKKKKVKKEYKRKKKKNKEKT